MTRKHASQVPRTGPGKRDRHTKERDDAIRKAAMSLARRGRWPSPAAVYERTGISESVIGRKLDLLIEARRQWEVVTGTRHPQWRDPARGGARDAPVQPAIDGATPLEEANASAKATAKRQRRQIADLKAHVAMLEEQVRRLLVGVRPAEIDTLLAAGSPKGLAGKAD